jgi:hypothetical protein
VQCSSLGLSGDYSAIIGQLSDKFSSSAGALMVQECGTIDRAMLQFHDASAATEGTRDEGSLAEWRPFSRA